MSIADVEPLDAALTRPRRQGRQAGACSIIPAPVGDADACEHPRLLLVQHLSADEGGVLVVDGRAAAGCLDQVLVAATADHRERHAPDVAGRRRVRRVEVAVGIEPGDRERLTGQASWRPAIAPAWAVQSPAQEDQASVGVAADGR